MAAPLLKEAMLGAFAYFIPEGVSSASPTSKPSSSPLTPWTNGTLGNVLQFQFGQKTIDDPWRRNLPSGGREEVNRSFVTQDWLVLKTREMGEIVWRLQTGVTGPIDEGTAQTPFLQLDRKIHGWLRLQGRGLEGVDRLLMDVWCECRLDGENTFEEKVVTPSLRFTVIKAVNGVSVAGNSIVFPVQS